MIQSNFQFRLSRRFMLEKRICTSILLGLLLMQAQPAISEASTNDSSKEKPAEARSAETKAAQSSALSKSSKGSKESAINAKSKDSSANPKAEKLEELTLNDLNDIAILLSFIREQCVNIYEETAREPVSLSASPELKTISSIPIKLKANKYLPARQEWLVFYLGVMEPVIRELVKDTKDIQSGAKQFVIPDSLENELRPLWDNWAADTESINKHLDELVPLFDDTAPNAESIRNMAVAVYLDAGHMEDLRKEIFVAVRNQKRAGNKDKILISPE